MKSEAAVEHVQEQLNLLRVGEVACHRLEHPADLFYNLVLHLLMRSGTWPTWIWAGSRWTCAARPPPAAPCRSPRPQTGLVRPQAPGGVGNVKSWKGEGTTWKSYCLEFSRIRAPCTFRGKEGSLTRSSCRKTTLCTTCACTFVFVFLPTVFIQLYLYLYHPCLCICICVCTLFIVFVPPVLEHWHLYVYQLCLHICIGICINFVCAFVQLYLYLYHPCAMILTNLADVLENAPN